ncbi:Nucleoid-associated protein YbaB [Actinomadura rubteroloni]|uniref:Nucleoid-associated protein YbaB n=1 Tax=Actinomadura rubteroloni TaxID=1926885 RepID=A0A2P4UNY4_9ACTN|nr:YbaB/EbfC family nucleoid-associated protein [Actinomadura rubteroloni]POM26742.1 Nucleoid-associated protein YbaB [Actinomadura rubteroloni]
MSYELATDDLDKLLGDAAGAAASLRPSTEPEAGARAEGHDPDGLIRVVVSAGGLVESVEIGPRALRLGSQEVADRAVAAINDALDRLAADAAEHPSPSAEAVAELTAKLEQTRNMSLQQLRAYTRSLQDLMNSL